MNVQHSHDERTSWQVAHKSLLLTWTYYNLTNLKMTITFSATRMVRDTLTLRYNSWRYIVCSDTFACGESRKSS